MDEHAAAAAAAGFCIRASQRHGRGGATGTKCGRWNPTTEQVKVLTELFRSGLRTPTTDQIQKISSQLSFYGKIESKNVFYWFQNHKARERQKRRRVLHVDEDADHQDANNKVSSTKCSVEMNQVSEPAPVIQTLQLFPLNSFSESRELLGIHNTIHSIENNTWFTCNNSDHHPTLDLRLSFH